MVHEGDLRQPSRVIHACHVQSRPDLDSLECLPPPFLIQTKLGNRVDEKHLKIELRASPVAALGVILCNGY